MDGGAEETPLIGQACANGTRTRTEPRQVEENRQSSTGNMESTAAPIHWKIYFKRFKKEAPETVKPLAQIMAEQEKKKKEQKEAKEERRKLRDETAVNPTVDEPDTSKPLSLSAKLKLMNEKPKIKVKLEGGESPDYILSKEAHIFDEAFAFYEKESVTLAELGFILKKIHPRYKPRRYGCKTLRAIYEKLDKYEILEEANGLAVRRKLCDEADKNPVADE